MAGTVRGTVEHYNASGIAIGTRDTFAAIVRFFDSHPQMQRIASNAGAPGSGLGTTSLRLPGFTSDVNYSGENAFGVWRWDRLDGAKVYILLQWAYSGSIGGSPGNPGTGQNASSVAVSYALDTSGGNPWAGGTANLGADVKTANVWAAAGGTLLVWPRANSVGGSGAVTKSYMQTISTFSSGGVATRFSLVMDDDNIFTIWDNGADSSYNIVHFFGKYLPRSGITPTTGAGFVSLTDNALSTGDWSTSVVYGSLAGATQYEGGAVVAAADNVRSCSLMYLGTLNNGQQSPNPLVSQLDIHDIFLRFNDANVPTKYGLFGKIDPSFLALVTACNSNDANAGLTKAVVGYNDTTFRYKFLIPWGGGVAPGSGVTVQGTQF